MRLLSPQMLPPFLEWLNQEPGWLAISSSGNAVSSAVSQNGVSRSFRHWLRHITETKRYFASHRWKRFWRMGCGNVWETQDVSRRLPRSSKIKPKQTKAMEELMRNIPSVPLVNQSWQWKIHHTHSAPLKPPFRSVFFQPRTLDGPSKKPPFSSVFSS